MIPMDPMGITYVLSRNPNATCFFCGGAGQESVIELHLKKRKTKFKTDEYVTFIGNFALNDREMELAWKRTTEYKIKYLECVASKEKGGDKHE